MLKYKRELICQNCGHTFFNEDNDMVLCKECWDTYLENQLRETISIRLTKEYVDNFLQNYDGGPIKVKSKIKFDLGDL